VARQRPHFTRSRPAQDIRNRPYLASRITVAQRTDDLHERKAGNCLRHPRCWEPPFLALKNDNKYHERHNYEEIIYRKAEIFTLHRVLIRHVRTWPFALIDTRWVYWACCEHFSVHVPVLLYYRLLYAATHFFSHCNDKKLLFQHLRFYRIIRNLSTPRQLHRTV